MGKLKIYLHLLKRYNEMAQKSILSFFGGGGAKNKANNNELKKPEKSLSSKKKGDIATVEKDVPKSKRSRRVIESDEEEENRDLDTSLEKKRARKEDEEDEGKREDEAESNLETSILDESRLDDTLNASVVDLKPLEVQEG